VVVGVTQPGGNHLDLELALARLVQLQIHHLVLTGRLSNDRPTGLHADLLLEILLPL
jgi:hypothetical protein